MTDQDHTTTGRKRRPWLLPVIVIAIAAIGLGIGVAVAARNSDQTADTTASSQISNVQQACQQWMGSTTGTTVPPGWCQNMTDWMRQQAVGGQSTGSMMWGNPNRMATTCRQWARTAGSPADSTAWCDDMVSWMQGHSTDDDD